MTRLLPNPHPETVLILVPHFVLTFLFFQLLFPPCSVVTDTIVIDNNWRTIMCWTGYRTWTANYIVCRLVSLGGLRLIVKIWSIDNRRDAIYRWTWLHQPVSVRFGSDQMVRLIRTKWLIDNNWTFNLCSHCCQLILTKSAVRFRHTFKRCQARFQMINWQHLPN